LQLVLNHFKDKETKATIELKAPDNNIHIVGASKDNDYLVVLDSGLDTLVASLRIQEKDILIFRSTEISRLKLVILDPSGHEKISSCSVMAISSSTKESSGDSVDIVEPPPHAVLELSSSDDDDIVREGTRKQGRPAKSQKMASTPSLSKKSGPSYRYLHVQCAFWFIYLMSDAFWLFCAHHKKVWYSLRPLKYGI
jgi:hypothetical protein